MSGQCDELPSLSVRYAYPRTFGTMSWAERSRTKHLVSCSRMHRRCTTRRKRRTGCSRTGDTRRGMPPQRQVRSGFPTKCPRRSCLQRCEASLSSSLCMAYVRFRPTAWSTLISRSTLWFLGLGTVCGLRVTICRFLPCRGVHGTFCLWFQCREVVQCS